MSSKGIVCIALLRGINVGKAKRISMAELRELVEELGFNDVRTLLNSGNVVFSASKSKVAGAGELIERAIDKRMGVSSKVAVVTAKELASIIASDPFASVATDPSRYLVNVMTAVDHAEALKPLAGRDWSPEALSLSGRVAYLWCADGILDGKLATAASRALGPRGTSRNWATMLKLHAMASGGAGEQG